MPEREPAWGMPRGVIVLVGVAAGVLAISGMREYRAIIAPLLFSVMIVIAAFPMQEWLVRKHVPRWLALVTTLLVIYTLVLLFVGLLVVSLARLAGLVPQYAEQFNNLEGQIADLLAQFNVSQQQINDVLGNFDLGRVVDVVTTVLQSLLGVLSGLGLLLVMMFFVALDGSSFGAKIVVMRRIRPDIAASLQTFAQGTRRYLLVSTVFGLVVAVLDTVALALLGVPLPVLWGLLAFVTNYIPNVGFVIGVLPPAFLGLLEGGLDLMVVVIIVYSVINFVIQSLIQPKFVGDSVGLSTTVTFLSLILWASVLGPLGAILAVPLTLLLKVVLLDMDPSSRWAGLLVSNHPGPHEDPTAPVVAAGEVIPAAPPSGGAAPDAAAASGDAPPRDDPAATRPPAARPAGGRPGP